MTTNTNVGGGAVVAGLNEQTGQVALNPFNKVLISWDFYRDIVDDSLSNREWENAMLRKAAWFAGWDDEKLPSLRPTKTLFANETEYTDSFLPLLLEESKQIVYRAKDMEMSDEADILVKSEATMDPEGISCLIVFDRAPQSMSSFSQGDLVLLYSTPPVDKTHFLPEEEKRNKAKQSEDGAAAQPTDGQNTIQNSMENLPKNMKKSSADTTIIQSTSKSSTINSQDPWQIKPPNPKLDNPHHLLGVVENTQRGSITIRVIIRDANENVESYLEPVPDDAQEKILDERKELIEDLRQQIPRDQCRMNFFLEALTNVDDIPSPWFLTKVMNLITMHREFHGLLCFPQAFLKPRLLMTAGQITESEGLSAIAARREQRKLRRLDQDRLEVPTALMNTLQELYNPSQIAALEECRKTEGITLIQGPPGTGKTTTIMAILSVISNASVQKGSSNLEPQMIIAQGRKRRQVQREHEQQLPESERKNVRAARKPWLTEPDYIQWVDSVKISAEDLEDPRPIPKADKTDSYVDIISQVNVAAPKRILVCAPSNGAIDEILKRLTSDPLKGGGIFDEAGRRYNPPVVRAGPNTHAELRKYSLDERVQMRMQGGASQQSREAIKGAVLQDARIVCSTLSVTGSHDLTAFSEGFDTIVVDEASQGVELSTLIPLKMHCRRLVLVGDPKQLPATVFSKVAQELGYGTSLFQRLEKAGAKVNMLSMQYRMHPAISRFPSLNFYDGQLLDAPKILETSVPVINYYDIPIFKPVVFLNLNSSDEVENTSRVNREESRLICQLIGLLKTMFSYMSNKDTWKQKVAVISPYAEQVRLIRKDVKVLFRCAEGEHSPIDVNTVDGFQGMEKDYVIFSAVRAQHIKSGEAADQNKIRQTNIGFLADGRRMNVALTRARLNLWIVGNGQYLAGHPSWKPLWDYTSSNDFNFNINYENEADKAGGYFEKWLVSYFRKVPEQRKIFSEAVPAFVERIERDALILIRSELQYQEELRKELEKQKENAPVLYPKM